MAASGGKRAGLLGHPQYYVPATQGLPTPGVLTKDTEGQVQAEAPRRGELDLVVVQRAVGEHALLDGRLHRALRRQGVGLVGRLRQGTPVQRCCRGDQHTDPAWGSSAVLWVALGQEDHSKSLTLPSGRPSNSKGSSCVSFRAPSRDSCSPSSLPPIPTKQVTPQFTRRTGNSEK